MVQFCMASLLATMVLDEVAMEMLRDRGEAPLLFEACITLLNDTLEKLHAEIERQAIVEEGGEYDDDGLASAEHRSEQLEAEKEEREVGINPMEGGDGCYDLALGVRLAEATSQVRICATGSSLNLFSPSTPSVFCEPLTYSISCTGMHFYHSSLNLCGYKACSLLVVFADDVLLLLEPPVEAMWEAAFIKLQ
jgi:hypothetical protein